MIVEDPLELFEARYGGRGTFRGRRPARDPRLKIIFFTLCWYPHFSSKGKELLHVYIVLVGSKIEIEKGRRTNVLSFCFIQTDLHWSLNWKQDQRGRFYALHTVVYSLNVSASCSKESRNRILEENCTLEQGSCGKRIFGQRIVDQVLIIKEFSLEWFNFHWTTMKNPVSWIYTKEFRTWLKSQGSWMKNLKSRLEIRNTGPMIQDTGLG